MVDMLQGPANVGHQVQKKGLSSMVSYSSILIARLVRYRLGGTLAGLLGSKGHECQCYKGQWKASHQRHHSGLIWGSKF